MYDLRCVLPIFGMRNFNNWIKLHVSHTPLAASSVAVGGSGPGGRRGKVLDVGRGKGGDLNKWRKAQIKEYVAFRIVPFLLQRHPLRLRATCC